mmetsp:Transcript_10672/g.21644  ORF Transcript_10672/g.21644 Transcript_10672/m.21644 type:complete len:230 (+) Transcript_10672:552-1241(+)
MHVMRWLREESAFIWVEATVLLSAPLLNSSSRALTSETCSSTLPGTSTNPDFVCSASLTSSFGAFSTLLVLEAKRSTKASLYSSNMVAVTSYSLLASRSFRTLNSSLAALGAKPVSGSTVPSVPTPSPTPPAPNIVNVFPLPVCPYAKIQTLKPSTVLVIKWLVSLKTFACVFPWSLPPAKTASKSQVFAESPDFSGSARIKAVFLLSALQASAHPFPCSLLLRGRILT